jgi:shikimate kinase
MSRNIVLYGMMGVGKTTVARLVADRLGRMAVDTDAEVERFVGQPIPAIFAQAGEAYFRAVEHQVIRRLATADDLVLSLGGGAVLSDDNVADLMLSSVLVLLDADADVLADRLRTDDGQRPLLAGDLRARIAEVLDERGPRYRQVADLTVDAAAQPDVVADAVVTAVQHLGDVLTPSEHEQVMP